jgi:heme-degrading monooxygenase HmoA
MIAVIFEVLPNSQGHAQYFDLAASLRAGLEKMDGFISIERFESLSQPGKLLSLSFWRDEQAVARWRNCEEHRQAQAVGRSGALAGYRLRVATVMRDYGLTDREQAPPDSRQAHDGSH